MFPILIVSPGLSSSAAILVGTVDGISAGPVHCVQSEPECPGLTVTAEQVEMGGRGRGAGVSAEE